jgi:hypothetical protein
VPAAAADRDFADRSAEAAAWAADWAAWYGRYGARAAQQSDRTVALYQKVADAISQGVLAPAAMQDMSSAFYKARGVRYSERFVALTTQFFSKLVEVAAAYSREMAEAVMPGAPSPPRLPRLDPSDPNAWFRQLTDYSYSLSAHIASSYRSFLDQVAAGRVDSENLKHVASEYLERRFPEYLRQLGTLYFELLSDLNDLRAEVEQDYLSGALAAAELPKRSEALALSLTGPSGGTTTATLSIANTREQPAVVRCHVGVLRRADGVDAVFPADISVTPEPLELAPGEEGRVTLAVTLDETVYAPNTLYVGALRVAGHGEAPLDIPLRILATAARPAPNTRPID